MRRLFEPCCAVGHVVEQQIGGNTNHGWERMVGHLCDRDLPIRCRVECINFRDAIMAVTVDDKCC